jgi:hypothetical protein
MTVRSARVPWLRRPGFSLIEVLALMAGLAAALALLGIVLVGALKLEQAGTGALHRLAARRDLAEQFRADVARAAEAPPRWQEDAAGPSCLILGDGKNRHVVYRWEGQRLLRVEFVGDEGHRREVGLGGGPSAVEFERSGGGRLLTLKLSAVRKDGVKQPSATITAALGGDLQ